MRKLDAFEKQNKKFPITDSEDDLSASDDPRIEDW
jgi:hypothetical protein